MTGSSIHSAVNSGHRQIYRQPFSGGGKKKAGQAKQLANLSQAKEAAWPSCKPRWSANRRMSPAWRG